MGKLSIEQQKTLSKVLKVNACPNCGSTKVKHSSDDVFHVVSLAESGGGLAIQVPLDYIPLLACTCPDCGYTSFFNLKTLSVADK